MLYKLLRICFRILWFCSLIPVVYIAGIADAYFDGKVSRYIIQNIDYLRNNSIYPENTEFTFNDNIFTAPQGRIRSNAANPLLENYNALILRYLDAVYLVDESDNIIHKWNLNYKKLFANNRKASAQNIYPEKAIIFPNGDLLATYTGWGDTPYGYGMVKIDKNSKLLWKYDDNTHHDIIINRDNQLIYSLTQKFVKWRGNNTLADYITIISPDGLLIRKISVIDAFEKSDFVALIINAQSRGLVWDQFHTNSIDIIDANLARSFPQFDVGHILISIRNMDIIAVIDPDAEKVVWAYKGIWAAQHSARFTEQGTIILFDNQGGGTKKSPQSRIIEINPRTIAPSIKYAGNSQSPFYSCAYGRLQLLENGNLFITETLGSRVFETNKAGEIVWQYKIKPYYQPRIPDIYPYGNKDKQYNNDLICSIPNLATAIVYGERYTPEQLPFLQELVRK